MADITEDRIQTGLFRLYKSGWPMPSEYSDILAVQIEYEDTLRFILEDSIPESRDFRLEKLGPCARENVARALFILGYTDTPA